MEQEDVLYRGAIIHTMDPDAPRAEAMLSHGGRIAAIGDRAVLEASAASARHVDLQGAVIPGFNDCHCHILSIGLNLEQVDVSADAVRTIG
ncbi:MAG: amidohydrolase, partial [Chloroflexota bacterium]|nr:amidohydrolase [Chloroflexota bacterium]